MDGKRPCADCCKMFDMDDLYMVFPPCGACHSDRGGPPFWLCIPCWDKLVGAATLQAIR